MTDPIPSPSLPALLTDEEIHTLATDHGILDGPLSVSDAAYFARGVEAAVWARSLAPSAPTIDAPGLVFMIAYGDKTAVRGMFDTSEQAHAFVERFKGFVPRDDITTLGGGAPGDHNGLKAAAAPTAAPFRVHVEPLKASNGVTYVVCLDRGDRPADAAPWDDGRMTPINRNNVDEANHEGAEWAAFLGVPFTPCEAVPDSVAVNTVPEYGAPTAATADSAMVVLRELVAASNAHAQACHQWGIDHPPMRFDDPRQAFASSDSLVTPSPTIDAAVERLNAAWTRASALVAQKEKT